MKYNDRIDIERIGVTGSYYYNISDNIISARILSSFWLVMEDSNDEFVPHLKKMDFGNHGYLFGLVRMSLLVVFVSMGEPITGITPFNYYFMVVRYTQ